MRDSTSDPCNPEEVFALPDSSFGVFRNPDGSLRWDGKCRGSVVAHPLELRAGARDELLLQTLPFLLGHSQHAAPPGTRGPPDAGAASPATSGRSVGERAIPDMHPGTPLLLTPSPLCGLLFGVIRSDLSAAVPRDVIARDVSVAVPPEAIAE